MWLVTMLIVTQSTRNFAIIAKEKGNFYFFTRIRLLNTILRAV